MSTRLLPAQSLIKQSLSKPGAVSLLGYLAYDTGFNYDTWLGANNDIHYIDILATAD
tara:strand:+ start:67 stop:237 length:171 start_codon:yes stop_codon:yes gene_type:complete